MPVRNEAKTLDATLDDVLGQVVDANFEVIVAEGRSTDGTHEILQRRVDADPRVRVVDNDHGGTPQALNAALAAARGRYLLRIDGHAHVPKNFVQTLVGHVRTGKAEAAGGLVRALGSTEFGRAVAVVHDSRFGIANAKHHYAREPTFVDHAPFCVYLTERVRSLGGWDEQFVRNQDYEFDFRYLSAGNRILLDPSVVYERRVRETPRALARQNFQYGWWKLNSLVRHPSSLKVRWLVPPALLACLVVGAALSWTTPGLLLLAASSAAYAAFLLVAAVVLGGRTNWRLSPRIALALATLHLSWGCGFLASAGQRAGYALVRRGSSVASHGSSSEIA